MKNKQIKLASNVKKGPFSGECVFSFKTSDGSTYESIAASSHCDEVNNEIDAYLVKEDENATYVSVPDGEILSVDKQIIREL